MSNICFDGILLAKRLVETHDDGELGANIVASAAQCRSQRECQHALRCAEAVQALTVFLAGKTGR